MTQQPVIGLTSVVWFAHKLFVNNRGKMVSIKEESVQINEARFAGNRKYKRGKIRQDHVPESNDSEAEVENNPNHGRRVDGSWILGVKKGGDWRYCDAHTTNCETLEHCNSSFREKLRKIMLFIVTKDQHTII